MALITSQMDKVYFFEVEIEVESKPNKVITDLYKQFQSIHDWSRANNLIES